MATRRWLALALGITLCGCSGGSGGSGHRASETFRAAEPVGVVEAAGKVWTVEVNGNRITGRAGPSDKPVAVSVGSTPLRAVYDGRLIWVSVFGANRVVAVDPSTAKVVRSVPVPGQPEGLVSAFGAIWVVRQQSGLLTRISPGGAVGPSYRLGDEPRLVTADDRYLFVSNFLGGTMTRIDARSGARRTSPALCDSPQDVIEFDGVLWVACTLDGKVLTVDPQTLRTLGTVTITGEPDAMRVVDSKLYVVTTNGPTLIQLNGDRAHPAIVNTHRLGQAQVLLDQANVNAVFATGRWWVSSPLQNKVIVYTP